MLTDKQINEIANKYIYEGDVISFARELVAEAVTLEDLFIPGAPAIGINDCLCETKKRLGVGKRVGYNQPRWLVGEHYIHSKEILRHIPIQKQDGDACDKNN